MKKQHKNTLLSFSFIKIRSPKITKLTAEVLLMTLKTQLKEKRKASHPSLTHTPETDFRKPVGNLEQGEIATILKQTERFLIFKHLLHIKIIYKTQIMNHKKNKNKILFIYEKTPNVKEKPSFKKGCNGCR